MFEMALHLRGAVFVATDSLVDALMHECRHAGRVVRAKRAEHDRKLVGSQLVFLTSPGQFAVRPNDIFVSCAAPLVLSV
jgi:hypothetical protein